MKYHMVYLKTKNVNLIKDMGMIPYKLHKLFGYDSYVSTYDDDDFKYLNNEVKGLKIDFVNKIFNNYTLDGSIYLLKKSKEIDILHIFHVTLSSFMYALIYKMINKKGKIYLKLDCSHKLVERIKGLNSFQKKLLKRFFMKIDLISVEQRQLLNQLIDLVPYIKNKFINIPNGIDYEYYENNNIYYDYNEKQNIILNVARIGTEEKNTEMLLNAFKKIPDIENKGWKLVLIGPIEDDFHSFIDNYFRENPNLKDIVEFKGNIDDRIQLLNYYKEAKIFCLTSNFESVGIAFIEAASLGDCIISTDVGIASELIKNDNGKIVKHDDDVELANALLEFINKESLQEECSQSAEICKRDYDWNNIISKLHSELRQFEAV